MYRYKILKSILGSLYTEESIITHKGGSSATGVGKIRETGYSKSGRDSQTQSSGIYDFTSPHPSPQELNNLKWAEKEGIGHQHPFYPAINDENRSVISSCPLLVTRTDTDSIKAKVNYSGRFLRNFSLLI